MEVIRVNLSTPAAHGPGAAPYCARGGGSIINVGSYRQPIGGGAWLWRDQGRAGALTRDMARPWAPRDPGELLVPGHLHTPHVGRTLSAEARRIRAAANMLGVEGNGLGSRLGRAVPASDRIPLHHRPVAHGG